MDIESVARHVDGLPYMTLKKAKLLKKVLTKFDCKQALELGFFHGVSSVYTAAILQDLGADRRLTTIDLQSARTRKPNIDKLASDLGLTGLIDVFYEERSYLWRLMKFIEEGRKFDFCYLDGGHNWDNTGFAFFLVDKLLVDGGVILFDDFNWTHEASGRSHELPDEERRTSAVERTWTLLVEPHPHYKPVWVKSNWALARKKRKLPLLPIRY